MSYVPSGLGLLFLRIEEKRYQIRIHTRAGHTPGEAPVETQSSLDVIEGERSSVGSAGPGSFSFDFVPNPVLASNRFIEDVQQSGGLAILEMYRGRAAELAAGSATATLALAASGVVTAAGTAPPTFGSEIAPAAPWTQGLVITNAGIAYSVEKILTASTLEVARYGTTAALTAATGMAEAAVIGGTHAATRDSEALAVVAASQAWKLYQVGIKTAYSGRVSIAGGEELSGAGQVASSGNMVLTSRKSTQLILPGA